MSTLRVEVSSKVPAQHLLTFHHCCNHSIMCLFFSSVCVVTVPSSSSGATRLAANFNTALTRFADSSTASFTSFRGSEPILLRPPGGAGTWTQAHKHTGRFSHSFGLNEVVFLGRTSSVSKTFWTFSQCRRSSCSMQWGKCPKAWNLEQRVKLGWEDRCWTHGSSTFQFNHCKRPSTSTTVQKAF